MNGQSGTPQFQKNISNIYVLIILLFFGLLCPFVRETKKNVNKCHENVMKKYKTFNNSLNINAKEPRFVV